MLCEDQVAVLPTEMQSLLLLLLSSTKVKVTLTDDPEPGQDTGIPSVKYNIQLGDLNIKTELSTSSNNSLGETVRTLFVYSRAWVGGLFSSCSYVLRKHQTLMRKALGRIRPVLQQVKTTRRYLLSWLDGGRREFGRKWQPQKPGTP